MIAIEGIVKAMKKEEMLKKLLRGMRETIQQMFWDGYAKNRKDYTVQKKIKVAKNFMSAMNIEFELMTEEKSTKDSAATDCSRVGQMCLIFYPCIRK